jgi:CTD small phosphatase-like protein 2
LDELDPENQIFSHRFYRPHCVVLPNELHLKDLRYLKRDLKDVVLVDNAAYSYSFQLDNGIPILPFYEGKDFELGVLENYLEKLVEVEDVRVLNREYFGLDQYKDF